MSPGGLGFKFKMGLCLAPWVGDPSGPGGGGLGGRVGYHRHHYNHNGLCCFDYLFNNESRSDHGESTTTFLARSRHADDLQPATENMKVETLTFTMKILWIMGLVSIDSYPPLRLMHLLTVC